MINYRLHEERRLTYKQGRYNGSGSGRGRGGFGGRGKNKGGGGGGGNGRWNAPRSEIPRRNDKLEEYYNTLNVVPEGEREDFWSCLKSELPNSFRFAGSRGCVAVASSLQ